MIIIKLNDKILSVVDSPIRAFDEVAKRENAKFFLTIGEPSFNTDEFIKIGCIEALKNNKTHYSDSRGLIELRNKIVNFDNNRYNSQYSVDEVLITNGSTEGLNIVLKLILNEGDEVIIFSPFYTVYPSLVKIYGGKVVIYKLNDSNYQLEYEGITSLINKKTKAIIINDPCNPTGAIFDINSSNILNKLMKNYDLFLIFDNVYDQIVFNDTLYKYFNFKEYKSRIIIVNSFSKSYSMTGWRIGYILSDENIVRELTKIHRYLVSNVNTFIQYGALNALDVDISSNIKEYKEKMEFSYEKVIEMGLECYKPKGGFYLFPSIGKYNMRSEEFVFKLLKSKQVALLPGIYFGDDNHIRISYCVEWDALKKGLELLKEFIDENFL